MKNNSRLLSMIIMLIGAIGIVLGVVFIAQGYMKKNYLQSAMRVEKITLGNVHVPNLPADEIIDNAEEAQAAGDTIRQHRRNISPSYVELLGGKHFDPSNPKQLSYAQALNMENYLYLAVLAFGLIDVVYASGVFMILAGIGMGCTGILLMRLNN